jgi:putative endonuclease
VARHLDLGRTGEDIAAAFLKRKGFRILERNYRLHAGEIDIIARDHNVLVFVEVKTRRDEGYADPSVNVDWRKQRKLRLLAERYIGVNHPPDSEVRFDVISIIGGSGPPRVEHIENAF